jgi:hypothetical protein
MEHPESLLKKAQVLIDRMPTWAIIVDREKLILAANPVARSMGLIEGNHCYQVLGQKEPCHWCNTVRCIDDRQATTVAVRVVYTPTGVRTVEHGGARVDLHHLPLTPELCLHFGFIGLLSPEDREICFATIRELVGEVPHVFLRSIDRVVAELSLNVTNPMDDLKKG